MYGMLLQVLLNQAEYDKMKETIAENSARIQELESKVGGPHEVADRMGIIIRNLPGPNTEITELDYIKDVISEIRAPGVDVHRDIIKAVRIGQTNAVKVEVRNENARASIMKCK